MAPAERSGAPPGSRQDGDPQECTPRGHHNATARKTVIANTIAELRRLVGEARRLAEDLTGQHAAVDRAFRDGYHVGFDAGHDVGRAQAENEMAAAWAEVARHVRGYASQPTHDALEERRWGPGGRSHFGDPRPGDFPGGSARKLGAA